MMVSNTPTTTTAKAYLVWPGLLEEGERRVEERGHVVVVAGRGRWR